MKLEEMTPELKEKALECETLEERKAFLKENAIELNEDELTNISGGSGVWFLPDSMDVAVCDPCKHFSIYGDLSYRCPKCGRKFGRIIKAGDIPDDYCAVFGSDAVDYH